MNKDYDAAEQFNLELAAQRKLQVTMDRQATAWFWGWLSQIAAFCGFRGVPR